MQQEHPLDGFYNLVLSRVPKLPDQGIYCVHDQQYRINNVSTSNARSKYQRNGGRPVSMWHAQVVCILFTHNFCLLFQCHPNENKNSWGRPMFTQAPRKYFVTTDPILIAFNYTQIVEPYSDTRSLFQNYSSALLLLKFDNDSLSKVFLVFLKQSKAKKNL